MGKESKMVFGKNVQNWLLSVEFIGILPEKGPTVDLYFNAPNGGVAKVKALPKLQKLVARINSQFDCQEKLRMGRVILGRIGNRSPVYSLRERCKYYKAIISSRRPSAIFAIIISRRNRSRK